MHFTSLKVLSVAFSITHLEALEASPQPSRTVTYSYGNKKSLVSNIGMMVFRGSRLNVTAISGLAVRPPLAMTSRR